VFIKQKPTDHSSHVPHGWCNNMPIGDRELIDRTVFCWENHISDTAVSLVSTNPTIEEYPAQA